MYSYIYLNSNGVNELVCSGIKAYEFFTYIEQKIENLMLLKGDYLGSRVENNFELFEGKEQIELLAKEMKKPHIVGDFQFLDYCEVGRVSALTNQELKDILFLSHMWKPATTPFFEVLQNRFVLLSHDDDWYCKIFCRNLSEFAPVLLGKIAACAKLLRPNYPSIITEIIMKLAESGVFIDLEEMICEKEGTDIKIYTIGEFSNVDDILNNLPQIKSNATAVNILSYINNEWTIS